MALSLTVAGGTLPAQEGDREGGPLLVLAAASLTDVLPRVAGRWEAGGGRPVRFSFAATSRLAPQALEGGADLFLSADVEWMGWVRERQGVLDPPAVLFHNGLVTVVPADVADPPRSPGELADGSGFVALAGENVPAGRYARAALEAAGVWTSLEGRVVRGGNVRSALEWVARGEARAGVVYATDARAEPGVAVAFPFDGPDDPRVTYVGAVLAGASQPSDAGAFLDFLTGPEAGRILRAAGFQTTPEGEAGDTTGRGTAEGAGGAAPDPWAAIRISVGVGLLTALLGLVPAVGVGWVLARRPFPGKTLLTTLVLAPLVLPPVVTGFLMLALLGRQGPLAGVLGSLGWSVPFTPAAPVLAALVVGFPLYVVAVRGAFEAVDPRYEEVSWTLGVPRARTFLRISVPLALPGIAAGAVLALARALGEFGATIVLAGNVEGRTRTIALAVYSLLESPGSRSRMWILVGASVALSLAALAGYEALSRRQRRRLEDRRAG